MRLRVQWVAFKRALRINRNHLVSSVSDQSRLSASIHVQELYNPSFPGSWLFVL